MPDKSKPIQIYPDAKLFALIQKEADSRRWKLGPTVVYIVEKYFREAVKTDKPAA